MPDERVRLFVAMELPEPLRWQLIKWREQPLRRGDGLRPLDFDSLHVTLCFLGWQAAREVAAIASACAALSEEPAPQLSVGEARWLPPRRPRVLAVELVDPEGALTRVQAGLSGALRAGGWYEPEKLPYLAHVTMARVARGGRVSRDPLPSPPRLEFEASRVTLFRSRLHRAGARYEPLTTIELSPPP